MDFTDIIKSASVFLPMASLVFSLVIWWEIMSRVLKKKSILGKNLSQANQIGFGLLLCSIYFYFFTPIVFGVIAKSLKVSTDGSLDGSRLIIISHGFYLIIAAIIYLEKYRNKIPAVIPDISEATEINELPPLSEEPEPVAIITHKPRSIGKQIQLGFYGFLAGFLPVILVILATYSIRSEEKANPLLKLMKSNPTIETFAIVAVLAIIIAPLIEEFVFRVIIQGFLTTRLRMSGWLAIILTALLFSIVHGVQDSYPLFPLAIVLGFLYHRTRSYIAIVTTHACFNAYNVVLLGLSIFEN